MTKLRALPDLSRLSATEKDRLILRLHARVRAEEARLNIAKSTRWRPEPPHFLASEGNKTPASSPGATASKFDADDVATQLADDM